MTTIDEAERRIRTGTARGVARALRELEHSTERDVPRGDPAEDPDRAVELAESARIDIDRSSGRVTGRLSYNTPYARYQHETVHLKHRHGGKAKFLESNLAALQPRLAQIIAEEIRRAL